MAVAKHLSWKFPAKKFIIFKLEAMFLLLLTIVVFFFSLEQVRWYWSIILSLLFVGLYFLVSFAIQKFRKVEEHYHVTPTHFHVTKKVRKISKKTKVPLKKFKHMKLDKFFLGGYLLTHDGKKHLVYFNKKDELHKFENFLAKHLKVGKKKSKK